AEIPPADGLAASVAPVCRAYTHVASVSSMRSKDLLARVAGLLDAAMVTDVIAAESPTVFKRPMVASSIIATAETLTTPVVLTVRPAGFGKPNIGGSSACEAISLTVQSKSKRVGVSARGGARPDLTQAKVVVSGGRPLRDAETYEKVIGGLADALGGA